MDWLGVKLREALEVFSSVSPAEPVWGWAGEHRAGFWPRRMLFEVVVHLTDLESALGIEGIVDSELAVEGIDEHLSNLPWTGAWDPAVRALAGQFDTIGLHATDGPNWRMVLMPGGMFWDRSDDPTAVTSREPWVTSTCTRRGVTPTCESKATSTSTIEHLGR